MYIGVFLFLFAFCLPFLSVFASCLDFLFAMITNVGVSRYENF